ncbi:Phosphohydrolase [Candidatus Desulfarcum epimagneticum]|uniref:Phosphohydrolase n=1 Tax=uncultured Desulfobacteraceae bacterium TaxID=218296 RepID=A0A484HKN1_9BACT|nr:Phosphohydrolase [uncultured Desulfobacteraceae bacterium]
MKCPGQDTQYWKPGAIFEAKCPECGSGVEFFKDDTHRKCRQCGHRLINPNLDFGCASYCQYAEECLGTFPPEALAQRADILRDTLKDRVAIEMKKSFKQDFKRIGHAMRVARHAERIGKKERGNMAVILAAAYLHDIGIPAAEEKHGSAAPKYQEKEGPPIARGILENLGAPKDLIEEVCDIVGRHHHPGPDESVNFKCVHDADLIVNLAEKNDESPIERDRVEKIIEKSFLTESGKKEARNVLLDDSQKAND